MIEYNNLSVEEYISILNTVGWKIPSRRLLEKSLKNGINVKCVIDNRTIGMARFVSDGGYAGLLMDVVIIPEFQGNGYGKLLINSLLNYLRSQLEDGEEMMKATVVISLEISRERERERERVMM